SRLADFHANCRASYRTLTGCPTDNYQACLGSYAGMIGFDITPNYVDSSPTGIVVSPWCSCRGSGNMEEECEKFLRDFTENPCLRESCHVLRSQQPPPTPPIPGGPGALPGHTLLPLAVASDACRASPAGGLPAETMGFVLSEIPPGAVRRPLEAFHLCRVKAEGFWSVILTVSARFLQTQPWGNAIQAFGNGTDVNLSPKNPSFQATQAPRVEKTPSLPDDLSDSTSLGTSVITTCTSVQVRGCSSATGETEPGQPEGLERHLMPEA
ncbi:hypothetical protein EI555_010691, partial [Monodon monoceros]